jgi:hypothetical protein
MYLLKVKKLSPQLGGKEKNIALEILQRRRGK